MSPTDKLRCLCRASGYILKIRNPKKNCYRYGIHMEPSLIKLSGWRCYYCFNGTSFLKFMYIKTALKTLETLSTKLNEP